MLQTERRPSAAAAFPSEADAARYSWLTADPYVSSREQSLLQRVPSWQGRLLEIGAGEGANLHHLTRITGQAAFALDTSADKLSFGRSQLPALNWIAGDALRLPFPDQVFDAVLLRDLLHHVPSRTAALTEAARVVRDGGLLTVLEANGKTLLAQAFGRLFAHERGLLQSSLESVKSRIAGLPELQIERAELIEPAPLYRLALHYRFGLPALGRNRLVRAVLETAERLCAGLGSAGSYILVVARGRHPGRDRTQP